MRVLLDENMAPRLRFLLAPHDAFTVEFLGWKGLKNGILLAHPEAAHFQAFITVDKNLRYQQNISTSSLGFIVLSSNLWPRIAPQADRLLQAIEACTPGSIQTIEL